MRSANTIFNFRNRFGGEAAVVTPTKVGGDKTGEGIGTNTLRHAVCGTYEHSILINQFTYVFHLLVVGVFCAVSVLIALSKGPLPGHDMHILIDSMQPVVKISGNLLLLGLDVSGVLGCGRRLLLGDGWRRQGL